MIDTSITFPSDSSIFNQTFASNFDDFIYQPITSSTLDVIKVRAVNATLDHFESGTGSSTLDLLNPFSSASRSIDIQTTGSVFHMTVPFVSGSDGSLNITIETASTGTISYLDRIDSLRSQIRSNNRFRPISRARINHYRLSPQELKARRTLRDFISEKEWRRYITNGFIMVKGQSDKWYQVFADRTHTVVWQKNKKIRELCIVTDQRCPPTDHVLTIKALIEVDENEVWRESNIRDVASHMIIPKHVSKSGLILDMQRRA